MEFAFPWPQSQGAWIAWGAAALTLAWGLVLLLAPRLAMGFMRLDTRPDHPEAVAEIRSGHAGFLIGTALAAILLDQPFLYFSLGVCWVLAAFGRLISILSDDANTLRNWLLLLAALILGALPLLYFLNILR